MKLLRRAPFSSTCNKQQNRYNSITIDRRSCAQLSSHAQTGSPCSLALCSASTPLQPSARSRIVVSATPPSSSSPAPAQPVVVPIPASQDEAVDAAVQCLAQAVQPLLVNLKQTKTARGFSNASRAGAASNRFGIEIPVAESSPAAAADLAARLLTATAARLKQRGGGAAAAAAPANWTVVYASDAAATAARARSGGGGGAAVLGLRQACRGGGLGGLLLLVEPSVDDVALVEQLLDEVWAGPAAVVLNPGWAAAAGSGGSIPPEYGRTVGSVDPVYSFLPCAIQGLLGRKEGAVLRAAEGPAGGAPWRILQRQGEEFVQVGAMPRRPTPADLELAFLNASAAASPLTKTAKFLRGLMPGGRK